MGLFTSLVESLAFLPPVIPGYSKDTNGLIWIDGGNKNKIPIVYIKHNLNAKTLLFSHGNAEDLGMSLFYLKEFSENLGVNLVAYDYDGYGPMQFEDTGIMTSNVRKQNFPSEKKTYANIRAVYEYMVSTLGIDAEKIILYGRSLGTGPTVNLAAELSEQDNVKFGGVILEAPLLSAINVLFNYSQLNNWVLGDIFVNRNKIVKITKPVFIIHGKADTVIPVIHGQTLYQMLQNKAADVNYLWIDGMNHNDFNYFFDQIKDHLINFINK
jgi:pimeloyl-ACP methyl ester carboxylesterase